MRKTDQSSHKNDSNHNTLPRRILAFALTALMAVGLLARTGVYSSERERVYAGETVSADNARMNETTADNDDAGCVDMSASEEKNASATRTSVLNEEKQVSATGTSVSNKEMSSSVTGISGSNKEKSAVFTGASVADASDNTAAFRQEISILNNENKPVLTFTITADAGVFPDGTKAVVRPITEENDADAVSENGTVDAADLEGTVSYEDVEKKLAGEAEKSGKKVTDFAAYDVSFYNEKDGKFENIEPAVGVNGNKAVKVSVEYADDSAISMGRDDDLAVYHLTMGEDRKKIEDVKKLETGIQSVDEKEKEEENREGAAAVDSNDINKATVTTEDETVTAAEWTVDAFSVFAVAAASDSTEEASETFQEDSADDLTGDSNEVTFYFLPTSSWATQISSNSSYVIKARYNNKGDGGGEWDTASSTAESVGDTTYYKFTITNRYGGFGQLSIRLLVSENTNIDQPIEQVWAIGSSGNGSSNQKWTPNSDISGKVYNATRLSWSDYNPSPYSVTLDSSSITLTDGSSDNSVTLTATPTGFGDNAEITYKWTTSNTSAVTVSGSENTAMVTAVENSASSGDQTATITVTATDSTESTKTATATATVTVKNHNSVKTVYFAVKSGQWGVTDADYGSLETLYIHAYSNSNSNTYTNEKLVCDGSVKTSETGYAVYKATVDTSTYDRFYIAKASSAGNYSESGIASNGSTNYRSFNVYTSGSAYKQTITNDGQTPKLDVSGTGTVFAIDTASYNVGNTAFATLKFISLVVDATNVSVSLAPASTGTTGSVTATAALTPSNATYTSIAWKVYKKESSGSYADVTEKFKIETSGLTATIMPNGATEGSYIVVAEVIASSGTIKSVADANLSSAEANLTLTTDYFSVLADKTTITKSGEGETVTLTLTNTSGSTLNLENIKWNVKKDGESDSTEVSPLESTVTSLENGSSAAYTITLGKDVGNYEITAQLTEDSTEKYSASVTVNVGSGVLYFLIKKTDKDAESNGWAGVYAYFYNSENTLGSTAEMTELNASQYKIDNSTKDTDGNEIEDTWYLYSVIVPGSAASVVFRSAKSGDASGIQSYPTDSVSLSTVLTDKNGYYKGSSNTAILVEKRTDITLDDVTIMVGASEELSIKDHTGTVDSGADYEVAYEITSENGTTYINLTQRNNKATVTGVAATAENSPVVIKATLTSNGETIAETTANITVTAHADRLYFYAALSKLSYVSKDDKITEARSMPDANGNLYAYVWKNSEGNSGTFKKMEKLGLTSSGSISYADGDIYYVDDVVGTYDKVIFITEDYTKAPTWTIDENNAYGRRTADLDIPSASTMTNPCFYAGSGDTCVYSANGFRSGYWAPLYTLYDGAKTTSSTLTETKVGSEVTAEGTKPTTDTNGTVDASGGAYKSTIRYVNSTLYDYYTDYELNGANRSTYTDAFSVTQRSWMTFREFNQAVSDYYQANGWGGKTSFQDGRIPLYTGHFQPRINGWGYQFNNISDTLNLYGYENEKEFFAVNNSVLDEEGKNYSSSLVGYTTDNNYNGWTVNGNWTAMGLVNDSLNGGRIMTKDGSMVLPQFNSSFLAGSNSKNAILGTTYNNVQFPFRLRSDPSITSGSGTVLYYTYDSTETSLYLKQDKDTKQYYLEDPNGTVSTGSATTKSDQSKNTNSSSAQGDPTYGYFPFNKNATSLNANSYNYGYGTKIEFTFSVGSDGNIAAQATDDDGNVLNTTDSTQPMMFRFSGDDDVWVFIDGNLVLDIGGSHDYVTGAINFSKTIGGTAKFAGVSDTLKVEPMHVSVSRVKSTAGDATETADYTASVSDLFGSSGINIYDGKSHTLSFFYMERGMWASNMMISYNMTPVYSFDIEKDWKDTNATSDLADADIPNKTIYAAVKRVKTSEIATAAQEFFADPSSSATDGSQYIYALTGTGGWKNTITLSSKADYTDYTYYVYEVQLDSGANPVYEEDSNGNKVPKLLSNGDYLAIANGSYTDSYKVSGTGVAITQGSSGVITNTLVERTVNFTLTKVSSADRKTALSGVNFKLYADNGDTIRTQVNLSGSAGSYAYTTNESAIEIVTDDNGRLSVTGLPQGTYWLEETAPADGYNALGKLIKLDLSTTSTATTRVTLEDGISTTSTNGAITAQNWSTGASTETFTLTNTPGVELPATGGSGWNIWVQIIGAIGFLAVILLQRKHVMKKPG